QRLQRDFAAIDRQLRTTSEVPETDWKAFESRVLSECRRATIQFSRKRVYGWVGAMSAAAAMVAMLTIFSLREMSSSRNPMKVAEIDVRPKMNPVDSVPTKAPSPEFSFARGSDPVPDEEFESDPPPSGSLIVACASPWLVESTTEENDAAL